MQKRDTDPSIMCFLRAADAKLPVKALCSKHGFSAPSHHAWKARFGGVIQEADSCSLSFAAGRSDLIAGTSVACKRNH